MLKRFVLVGFVVAFALCVARPSVAEPLTPALCKEKVKEAAALVQAEGEAAYDKLKDPKGKFRFADGKGYVWVHNLDGVMLMHPIKPALDGRGLLDMRDVNGTYLFLAMNETVEDHQEGWVPYAWPKPGEKKSSPKVSYVVLAKHGGKEYVVGSGMYDVTAEDVKAQFPGDKVYEEE